ncbi:MAG: tRNA pseudouridine(54/55) synthase Pus10 [Sulfolobales archaeon]
MSRLDCEIISKAVEILRKYPLCSRCLGRLFAKYGLGLSNITRGNAIKVLLLMELHRLITNDVGNLSLLKGISSNVGVMPQLISRYSGTTPRGSKCYICSNKIEEVISKLVQDIISELERFKVRNFIISVRKGSEMERRELEIITEFNLDSWESIRRELKRELGKKVKALLNIEPEFRYPDVSVLVDLDTLDVRIIPTPTYILCRYVKLGRRVSQVRWVSKDGVRKYPIAVEDVVEPLIKLFDAEELQLHTIGREDVDVRVLGSGRPLVIELKQAKDKRVGIEEVAKSVPHNELITLLIDRYAEPKYIREFKSKKALKVYRLLILSKKPLSSEEAELLVREFSNRVVRQKVPTRILRRRDDTVHLKRIYDIKVRLVDEHLIEMLVKCDDGLYVKELVHGDGGRTYPNMAEVLNSDLTILEVDVIDITY